MLPRKIWNLGYLCALNSRPFNTEPLYGHAPVFWRKKSYCTRCTWLKLALHTRDLAEFCHTLQTGRPAVNAVQWRHYVPLCFNSVQKVKHNSQEANQEISFGNVYIILNSWQNCFTLFDQSCLMFKLSSMQYSDAVVIQTRSQSRNEINTLTEYLVQKHNNFLQLKRGYLVLNW